MNWRRPDRLLLTSSNPARWTNAIDKPEAAARPAAFSGRPDAASKRLAGTTKDDITFDGGSAANVESIEAFGTERDITWRCLVQKLPQ
jgi:hypothetical protein